MGGLRHFLLTNFNVCMGDAARDRYGAPVRTAAWLEERFLLFERFCLPSVLGQSCADFTWLVTHDAVETPPSDRRRLAAYEASVPSMRLVAGRSFADEIAASLDSQPCRLVTTRLDNDDALHRTAIARIRRQATGGEGPEFLNFPFGYCYAHPEGRALLYEHRSNPFISLAEDYDGGPPLTAPCTGHHLASEVAPVRQLGDEPSWLQVIHGRNVRNSFKGRPCPPPDLEKAFNVRPAEL